MNQGEMTTREKYFLSSMGMTYEKYRVIRSGAKHLGIPDSVHGPLAADNRPSRCPAHDHSGYASVYLPRSIIFNAIS
jgi:hypothetical protein